MPTCDKLAQTAQSYTLVTVSLHLVCMGRGSVWDRQQNKRVNPIAIFQLIYTCALTENVKSGDLETIALTSRKRNLERGITGILLCQDGSVLQVLEGDKAAVLELYGKIASDPRVANALVLIQRTTTEREFPKWSMGFKNADQTDAAFKLCAKSFPDVLPDNPSPEVGTIGRTFARVNGLA